MSIAIANRQRTRKINARLLKQIMEALLVEMKIENAELEINLVGTKEMAEMNWKFLQHQGSTDVITFDYAGNAGRASCLPQKPVTRNMDGQDACPTLSGELFVCVDEAIRQAQQFRTSWQSEIVRYVVHGVLHLLGHDDLKLKSRRKMKREENRLVQLLAKRFSLAQLSRGVKLGA